MLLWPLVFMQNYHSLALRPHVLVVDDDNRLRELLRRYLAEKGFFVSTASCAEDARTILSSFNYDILVLDVMMPGETGFELVKSMRSSAERHIRQMPVLLLTARGEPGDRIEGFESGADDYLAKPFEPRELLLRLNAILRRMPKLEGVTKDLKLGQWIYNAERDELRGEDGVIRLSGMEAGLMRVLSSEPGKAFSRETLAERSGLGKSVVNDRTVDVQVARLRRKIEEDTKNPRYLVTVRGEGYMLIPDIET